jgi:quercetin 2,3-dioxygenase
VRAVGDARARTIVGEGSPLRLVTPATYQDVVMPVRGHATFPVAATWQGFVYVLSGDAAFGPERQEVRAGQFAALGTGGALPVAAGRDGVRFLLGAGAPRRETVRWNGPYVD